MVGSWRGRHVGTSLSEFGILKKALRIQILAIEIYTNRKLTSLWNNGQSIWSKWSSQEREQVARNDSAWQSNASFKEGGVQYSKECNGPSWQFSNVSIFTLVRLNVSTHDSSTLTHFFHWLYTFLLPLYSYLQNGEEVSVGITRLHLCFLISMGPASHTQQIPPHPHMSLSLVVRLNFTSPTKEIIITEDSSISSPTKKKSRSEKRPPSKSKEAAI